MFERKDKMRYNILISTTRQWNPGDEFIMNGSLNILKRIADDHFNPVIFNRNPDIRSGSRIQNKSKTVDRTYKWDQMSFKGKSILQLLMNIGHYDNSWKDGMNPANIDLALFAGSPEWYGTRLKQMYQIIDENNIPAVFLGLGAGDSVDFKKSDPVVYRVLSKARLITVRDRETEKMLSQYGATYIPCPALLSANSNRVVNKIEKIALIYATDKTLKGNNVSKQMHEYLLKLYPEIAKRYNCGLICHYIDEIDQAKKDFPGMDIFYSYDAKDYEEIYNHFDLVVGGRVHGIGMSASLGIPGIMIKHDNRSNTTDGFLAESVPIGTNPLNVIELMDKYCVDIEAYSERLIKHKETVMNQYIQLFQETTSDLFQNIVE